MEAVAVVDDKGSVTTYEDAPRREGDVSTGRTGVAEMVEEERGVGEFDTPGKFSPTGGAREGATATAPRSRSSFRKLAMKASRLSFEERRR